ncbi:DUF47 domain-containing protein [Slackia heliotrinireducens]|uniref:DUF47 domain-containing protein n=1 Tax=Slackia heliotrinireducens TaxID=84110 RepID=UPI003315FA8E
MAGKKRKFDYFDAFEEQAVVAHEMAELLKDTVANYENDEEYLMGQIEKARDLEHKGDEICHSVFEALAVEFIAPIDREDIIELTQRLDDVSDHMESAIQHFYMLNVNNMHEGAAEFTDLLCKSTKKLMTALDDFRNFKKSKKIRKLIIDVCDVEEEVDALFFAVVRKLHTEENENALHVYKWDELFQRLENAADACEQAADRMTDVLLKNA